MKTLPTLTLTAVLTAVLLPASTARGQDTAAQKTVRGRIDAVTLYRGQALIRRVVPIDAPAGQIEIVVSGLPAQVRGATLFAEGDGVEVRSVRYRTRALSTHPVERVREFDQQIEDAQDEASWLKKRHELVAKKLAYLQKLDNFTAHSATTELSSGVLDATALERITMFSFEQQNTLFRELQDIEIEQRDSAKALSLLTRRRAELTSSGTRTEREAVLFLEKRTAGAASIKLHYLVGGASWTPAYNFRAQGGADQISVEYNALIQQMSGEDWGQVELTLSTASPALSSQGPGLAPFRVALAQNGNSAPRQQEDLARAYQAYRGKLRKAELGQRGSQKLFDNRSFNWRMNVAANDVQCLELLANPTDPTSGATTEEGPSVTYHLASAVSLASRSDIQMVPIVSSSLPANFYHVATPVLTSYVYREAELTNNAVEALLAGQVNVYLDGRFVGRGEIPMVARGQTFVVGFGTDSQLRARRDLVARTERVRGGNREVSFSYRVAIENFKSTPVKLRLIDRIPVSEDDDDVRITIADLADPLSEDKVYVTMERPKGLLRWDLEIAAESASDAVRMVEYGFTMEFDKSKTLASAEAVSSPGDLQNEFIELQNQRSVR